MKGEDKQAAGRRMMMMMAGMAAMAMVDIIAVVLEVDIVFMFVLCIMLCTQSSCILVSLMA